MKRFIPLDESELDEAISLCATQPTLYIDPAIDGTTLFAYIPNKGKMIAEEFWPKLATRLGMLLNARENIHNFKLTKNNTRLEFSSFIPAKKF